MTRIAESMRKSVELHYKIGVRRNQAVKHHIPAPNATSL